MMKDCGYARDAEACGRVVLEIIKKRKPKIWNAVFQSADDEFRYVAWAAKWAFHWAAKDLAQAKAGAK